MRPVVKEPAPIHQTDIYISYGMYSEPSDLVCSKTPSNANAQEHPVSQNINTEAMHKRYRETKSIPRVYTAKPSPHSSSGRGYLHSQVRGPGATPSHQLYRRPVSRIKILPLGIVSSNASRKREGGNSQLPWDLGPAPKHMHKCPSNQMKFSPKFIHNSHLLMISLPRKIR